MMAIVTGGRNYAGSGLGTMLDHYDRESPGFLLIVGCATGADEMARAWARERSERMYGPGVTEFHWREFKADWRSNGKLNKGAGPERNHRMVIHGVAWRRVTGQEVICLSAYGGNGTRDCVERCRIAGIEIVQVDDVFQPLSIIPTNGSSR